MPPQVPSDRGHGFNARITGFVRSGRLRFRWLSSPVPTTVTSVLTRLWGRRASVYLGLGLLLRAAHTGAETTTDWNPPWHEGPMVPLPAGTRSVEIAAFDTPVWDAPMGVRRGSLKAGARLPLFGSRRASGSCAARWFLVGPLAWVCGEHARPSPLRFDQANPSPPRDGLPYRYYFAGSDGAFAYSALSLVGEGIPDSQLEPGFAVAAVYDKTVNGENNVHTTNGLWIPAHDLVPIHGSTFEGVHLINGEWSNVGWVVGSAIPATDAPFGKQVRRLPPLTRVQIKDRAEIRHVTWFRTERNDWVRANAVRRPNPAPPPLGVGATERWLDVDTKAQVLTAYVGARPVFTTLVSTGKGSADSESATPTGEHRIWVKLASSDMNNVEDQAASRYYAIEAVPWVQFFKGGYGLHAAFWHDAYGAPRSHGCVNLSPKDAAFLFGWTEPQLPAGWHAVLPTSVQLGTLVRVR